MLKQKTIAAIIIILSLLVVPIENDITIAVVGVLMGIPMFFTKKRLF